MSLFIEHEDLRDVAADDPNAQLIYSKDEFDPVLDALAKDGIGLGNTPFRELVTDEAKVNFSVDGCLCQRPNLNKEMTFLKTRIFNPFDAVTAFYDADKPLSPEARSFIDAHAFQKIAHTANRYGERRTLPPVEASDKVIIVGDSVANGAMIDDGDTISSQLQKRDPGRQYINLGIGGASAWDVVCSLRDVAEHYAGQLRELIYVYCENDFAEEEPMGSPDEVIAWLRRFAAEQGLQRVTVVYAPYIYNVVPQVTRVRDHKMFDFPFHGKEKNRLFRAVASAGFEWIDFVDIATSEQQRTGTQFAALGLYVDHAHFSRLGVERLVDRILAIRSARN